MKELDDFKIEFNDCGAWSVLNEYQLHVVSKYLDLLEAAIERVERAAYDRGYDHALATFGDPDD